MFYQSTKDSNGDIGPNFLQNESSQSSQILPLTRETESLLWEHSYMTSDVLGVFLTYLPTYPNQILYYLSLFSKIR